MLLVIASLSNCSVIMLKKFSLGFKSELWGGILNILTPTFSITARAKFPLQCPSCEKTFSSFASHYENIKSKFCAIKSEKYLPFILSYLSHIMTPLLYAMATTKCAILPPLPTFLLFAVQPWLNPSLFLLHSRLW